MVGQEQGWDKRVKVRFQGAEGEVKEVTQVGPESRVVRVLGGLELQVLVEVEGVMAIQGIQGGGCKLLAALTEEGGHN